MRAFLLLASLSVAAAAADRPPADAPPDAVASLVELDAWLWSVRRFGDPHRWEIVGLDGSRSIVAIVRPYSGRDTAYWSLWRRDRAGDGLRRIEAGAVRDAADSPDALRFDPLDGALVLVGRDGATLRAIPLAAGPDGL